MFGQSVLSHSGATAGTRCVDFALNFSTWLDLRTGRGKGGMASVQLVHKAGGLHIIGRMLLGVVCWILVYSSLITGMCIGGSWLLGWQL